MGRVLRSLGYVLLGAAFVVSAFLITNNTLARPFTLVQIGGGVLLALAGVAGSRALTGLGFAAALGGTVLVFVA
jgi:3-dehydroquinate synthetase